MRWLSDEQRNLSLFKRFERRCWWDKEAKECPN
jgi:hypothetical protein